MNQRRTFFDEDAGRRLPTLIFEGCDGSGKSTAIANLSDDPREVLLFRQGEYKNVPEGHLWERNLACLLFDHGSDRARMRVLDRGWVSDAVYSPVFRGHPSRVSVAEERLLERVALAAAAVAVYCLPPLEVCLDAWRSRRHDEFLEHEAQLCDVYGRYRGAVRDNAVGERHAHRHAEGLPAIVYDWTTGRAAKEIPAYADAVRRALGLELAPAGFLGAWRPDKVTLVVTAGVGADAAQMKLSLALEELAAPELDLCWLDADAYVADVAVLDVAAKLRPKRTIAVGVSALDRCDKLGLGAVAVSTYCQPATLKRMLEEALP